MEYLQLPVASVCTAVSFSQTSTLVSAQQLHVDYELKIPVAWQLTRAQLESTIVHRNQEQIREQHS